MSAPFNNFLSGNTGQVLKSYAHASGLYLGGNRMAKAPKLGFIYFVSFNLNPLLGLDPQWVSDLGFLAKKVDLPKFKVATQTLNQYNRKTNIQTKLTYEPISLEFHDDNSEITSMLWRLYYSNYYNDGQYNENGEFDRRILGDSKYDESPTKYGYGLSGAQEPFFTSVDIFSLHQGRFSQYSISNPMISSWDHDSLDQSNGTKVLQNKMTLVYDSVAYYQGEIVENNDSAGRFRANWYDNNIGLPNGYPQPSNVKIPSPQVQYPSPIPQGASLSEREKIAVKATPVYSTPRPIGAGTFGVSSYRPPSLLGGISVWYGYGGLHTSGVINAGPVRLVLKR